MTRPIVWAFGTLATAALSATAAGDRIAARFGLAGSRPAQLQRSSEPSRTLTLSADLYGHFVVHPALNGQRVRMLVDTGASFVALSHEDAAMLGLKVSQKDFTRRSSTANGVVETAPVRIKEIRIGDIAVRDVEAVVLPPRALSTSLLGMSFLKRLEGFEVAKGRLVLRG
jgi:aspartyl protease family protein